MKAPKLYLVSLSLATLALATVAVHAETVAPKATATVQKTVTVKANPTIAAALHQFKDLTAFENSPILAGHSVTDDAYLIKMPPKEGGWLLLPAGDSGTSGITDMKTQKTVDSFSRQDPRGATIAQVKKALQAQAKS